MNRKYNRRKRTVKESKGSIYDMLAAFEDKLDDLEYFDFDESLDLESAEDDKRKWLTSEVTSDEYKKLKRFLVDHNIKHEASGAYNLIHVKCYVNEYEKKLINKFIDDNFY